MTIASCESGDFMRANGEYEQNTSESNQTQVHPDVVAYVASHMPDQDDLIDVAELFKAFGFESFSRCHKRAVGEPHEVAVLPQLEFCCYRSSPVTFLCLRLLCNPARASPRCRRKQCISFRRADFSVCPLRFTCRDRCAFQRRRSYRGEAPGDALVCNRADHSVVYIETGF